MFISYFIVTILIVVILLLVILFSKIGAAYFPLYFKFLQKPNIVCNRCNIVCRIASSSDIVAVLSTSSNHIL